MRKLGALDNAMENFGLFDDAMGNWKSLIKLWGSAGGGGAKWPDGKTANFDLDGAMEHFRAFDDIMGNLETPAMGKLGPPGDLMGKLGAPRLRIRFKRFYTAPLHSFKLTGHTFLIEKF